MYNDDDDDDDDDDDTVGELVDPVLKPFTRFNIVLDRNHNYLIFHIGYWYISE